MKIQQHAGVVVDAAGIPAGLRQASVGERGVARGKGGAKCKGCGCPPSPYLYRGLGGAALGDESPRGRRPRGGFPPSQVGGAPTPRVSNPRHRGARGSTSPPGAGSPPTSTHGDLRDRWPHPVDPRDPSGGPGTISITPETFPVAKTGLPIYNSSPPDHSGTPRDVRDLIRDSEQHSVTMHIYSL